MKIIRGAIHWFMYIVSGIAAILLVKYLIWSVNGKSDTPELAKITATGEFPISGQGLATRTNPLKIHYNPCKTYTGIVGDGTQRAKLVLASDTTKSYLWDN